MALPSWPPVVYLGQRDTHESALRQALQRAEAELGKPAQILFVIQEKGE